MSNFKFLVVGNFKFDGTPHGGQIIKTKVFYNLLLEKKLNVNFWNIDRNIRSFIGLPKEIIWFFKCDYIFFLPGQNSLKLLMPFFYFFSVLFNKKLVYVVIGGWLPTFVNDRFFLRFILRRLDKIFVETVRMQTALAVQYNFENVEVLPNFRISKFSPLFKINHPNLKCVFVARITPLKGVDFLIKIAEDIKNRGLENVISIDFYGPMDSDFSDDFLNAIAKFNNLEYRGFLQLEEIYSTLTNYDVMLFPTRWPGEGFPGTIVDSYIAGLPVIASSWMDIPEFIEDGVSGFLVELNDSATFVKKLSVLLSDPKVLLQMKRNAFNKSFEYNSNFVYGILQNSLNI